MVGGDGMQTNTSINVITHLELDCYSLATTKVDITWTAVVSIAGVVLPLLAGAREARVLGWR